MEDATELLAADRVVHGAAWRILSKSNPMCPESHAHIRTDTVACIIR